MIQSVRVQLPISTRGIGFYVQRIFNYCEINNLNLAAANLFSVYRIALISLEYKIRYCSRGLTSILFKRGSTAC